jgi:hypothetical protein
MNTNNLIHGKSIFAMESNQTSVTEMLQYMGVEPTEDIVNAAMDYFMKNSGGKVDMEALHQFLLSKDIIKDYNIDTKKVASVIDLR